MGQFGIERKRLLRLRVLDLVGLLQAFGSRLPSDQWLNPVMLKSNLEHHSASQSSGLFHQVTFVLAARILLATK